MWRVASMAVLLLFGGGAADAQTAVRPSPIAGFVTEAATRAGVPESWIWSVMRIESAGNLHAVSHAGAMGLMQLMPATWTNLRARLSLGDDPFDPHDNVLAGATYLREMHDRYGAPGFLAAYNAGSARYSDYLLHRRPLPIETTNYVSRLAPMLDGGSLPDPLAWTRATLFVGAAGNGLAAPVGTAGAPAVNAAPADAPPPDGLFVRTATAAKP